MLQIVLAQLDKTNPNSQLLQCYVLDVFCQGWFQLFQFCQSTEHAGNNNK